MRPYPYLIVLTEGGLERLTPAADYTRNGDMLTVTMPDRSSFDIDLKNKRIQWPQFVETFENIEIRV
ncbi:MAG: hypothetical protein PHQ41_10425 [Candidatus Cloacimonetes bacterium]|jgi:hypothetical protein|nr:hypothetical protein [Candidatus Cloacimonadota bacterium]